MRGSTPWRWIVLVAVLLATACAPRSSGGARGERPDHGRGRRVESGPGRPDDRRAAAGEGYDCLLLGQRRLPPALGHVRGRALREAWPGRRIDLHRQRHDRDAEPAGERGAVRPLVGPRIGGGAGRGGAHGIVVAWNQGIAALFMVNSVSHVRSLRGKPVGISRFGGRPHVAARLAVREVRASTRTTTSSTSSSVGSPRSWRRCSRARSSAAYFFVADERPRAAAGLPRARRPGADGYRLPDRHDYRPPALYRAETRK